MMRSAIKNWILWTGISTISLAMLVGPLFSPDEFSWLRHSTSEQAGQHLSGAWIMRAGFIAYGSSIILSAAEDWRKRPLVRLPLLLFGFGLLGAAVWSNAPIVAGLPTNMREDWLHSVASGIVGFAFASACAGRLISSDGGRRDVLAWSGLLIAVLVPVSMNALPGVRGLLQRGMFIFSFIFVVREFGEPRT